MYDPLLWLGGKSIAVLVQTRVDSHLGLGSEVPRSTAIMYIQYQLYT